MVTVRLPIIKGLVTATTFKNTKVYQAIVALADHARRDFELFSKLGKRYTSARRALMM